jgi:pyruvate dehydrogenase E1 component alpha subunit
MGAHTTSDDPTRYRQSAELTQWAQKDPIARLEKYLLKNGWADADFLSVVEKEGDQLAQRIRESVRAMADPGLTEFFDTTYAGEHPLVTEERQWFKDYEASFTGGS